ncbi:MULTISPECIES: hypothetical protein [Bacillus]|uniref:hypothetical protein n=1 Tax=Bacillus TaxID=1386 RepID=UPI001CDB4B33|nr:MULTISPECIES: hypothetical protein [Bacillus]MCY7757828.1 hypothetical protein [Bacillus inaquosorum]MCY8174866.1 hypothetical protein [Bacillus inaquosorum]MCY8731512.1 hypothetical protein [Bacillus inaquosorum]
MKKQLGQTFSYKEMAKGYGEMAAINSTIAQEDNHLENEAEVVRFRYKTLAS